MFQRKDENTVIQISRRKNPAQLNDPLRLLTIRSTGSIQSNVQHYIYTQLR